MVAPANKLLTPALFCFLAGVLLNCTIHADEPTSTLNYEWVEEAPGIYRSPQPVHVTGSGQECFRRTFVPPELGQQSIRGIIVWDAEPHYRPAKANRTRSTIQTQIWRDFAAKHRMGMAELATRPIDVQETVSQVQKIFEDMDVLYNRTECTDAFFTFGGTSGTGHDTLQLAAHPGIADRMIAGIPCSVTVQGERGGYEFTDQVPILVMTAGLEERARSSAPRNQEAVTELVRQGKPFTLAVRLSAKHPEFRDDIGSDNREHRQIANATVLALAWLDSILKQRLPNETSSEEPAKLRELNLSKSWIGTYEVSPQTPAGIDVVREKESDAVARAGHILTNWEVEQFSGDKADLRTADIWFPDQAFADAWQQYHKAGVVTNQ